MPTYLITYRQGYTSTVADELEAEIAAASPEAALEILKTERVKPKHRRRVKFSRHDGESRVLRIETIKTLFDAV